MITERNEKNTVLFC